MTTAHQHQHHHHHSRTRSSSFASVMDEVEASGILEGILRDNNVLLGGSSIGKGFQKAARFYLQQQQKEALQNPTAISTMSTSDKDMLLEDAFYVVDLGVIVSQVYQWRKVFPRVEPFYAVKCNPDMVIVKTLLLLGCHFDCASHPEIALVLRACDELQLTPTQRPQIIYANPCKARKHLAYAVQHGVTLVTFDNVQEVYKCAQISAHIQLVLRIVTDDRGSQCRLSSKYGAPKARWRPLLHAAKTSGLPVVGVSFHVGSGCRDAQRYALALQDARALFDMAQQEFGFDMTLLDIGGGFPGETHSVWNPEVLDDLLHDDDDRHKEGLEHSPCSSDNDDEDDNDEKEDDSSKKDGKTNKPKKNGDDTPYMFFTEIAEQVAPMIDELFPDPKVRVIGEPGRYFVAAAATLVTNIVGARSNEIDQRAFFPEPIPDVATSHDIFDRSREEEHALVRQQGKSFEQFANNLSFSDTAAETTATDDNHLGGEQQEIIIVDVWDNITEELNNYAKYFAKQSFVTQETDAYNDGLDLYNEDFATAADLLGVPDPKQMRSIVHSVEGMNKAIAVADNDNDNSNQQADILISSLAAAGEAAVNGMVLQAVADSAPLQDDYAYYVNDGVYGAFNNLMFDHATVRPRFLRLKEDDGTKNVAMDQEQNLYASTVFGPTCDSIDVIARSVLLPKLSIGDWLYFQNMGAYTMAAASSFNGFTPTEKMYVCSVQPEFFEELIAGPDLDVAVDPAGESDKVSDTKEGDQDDSEHSEMEEKKDDVPC